MVANVPRTYQLQRRRDSMHDTRQRIVDAAVRLHGSVGPARTTISAVADEASVQRSTVYRHFPDEAALFSACTSHWMALHPWPRPRDWQAIPGAAERLRFGLRELYAFFDENREMLGNSFRDIAVMPPFVGELMGALIQEMLRALIEPWPREMATNLEFVAALRAALDFRASRALVEAGLPARAAADLQARMVASLASQGNEPAGSGAR